MHQEVSALQQRIFSPRISLGKDFNGCSLLVEPARHSDVGSQVFGDLAPNRKEHPLENTSIEVKQHWSINQLFFQKLPRI